MVGVTVILCALAANAQAVNTRFDLADHVGQSYKRAYHSVPSETGQRFSRVMEIVDRGFGRTSSGTALACHVFKLMDRYVVLTENKLPGRPSPAFSFVFQFGADGRPVKQTRMAMGTSRYAIDLKRFDDAMLGEGAFSVAVDGHRAHFGFDYYRPCLLRLTEQGQLESNPYSSVGRRFGPKAPPYTAEMVANSLENGSLAAVLEALTWLNAYHSWDPQHPEAKDDTFDLVKGDSRVRSAVEKLQQHAHPWVADCAKAVIAKWQSQTD